VEEKMDPKPCRTPEQLTEISTGEWLVIYTGPDLDTATDTAATLREITYTLISAGKASLLARPAPGEEPRMQEFIVYGK